MGDFDEWSDYHFMWTQWKSNKIIDGIKPYKEILKEQEAAEKGDGSVDHSLASTFATTDKESASSTENLINTPKRQAKGQALSALKKQETLTSSNSKQLQNSSVPKPFTTGSAPRRLNTKANGEDGEIKEENITSHSYSTTNHQENNFHLSNKKAIYYNMKIYYESTQQCTFDYLPLTYHIKDGLTDNAFSKFEETYNSPSSHPDLAKYPAMGT